MALLKCPDCGNDLSSSAASCPHCGRPNRRRSSSIELSGILGLAVICAGVLLWRLSAQSPPHTEAAAPSAPETAFARASRDREGLTANISYNRTLALLRVENRDAFTWTRCQLSLNAHGVSSGYLHEVESIAPGIAKAALIGSADFIGEDGRPFDAGQDAVATLEVACDTPRGPLSYGGSFPPP